MAQQRHIFYQRVGVVTAVVKVLLDNLSLLLDDDAELFVTLENFLPLHGLFCGKTATADIVDGTGRARESRAVAAEQSHHHRNCKENQPGRSSAVMRTRARTTLFLKRKIAAQGDRACVIFTAGSEVTTANGDCRER